MKYALFVAFFSILTVSVGMEININKTIPCQTSEGNSDVSVSKKTIPCQTSQGNSREDRSRLPCVNPSEKPQLAFKQLVGALSPVSWL